MKFIPSEVRERHRFVERTKTEVVETLGHEAVKAHLGEIAEHLLILAEEIYVPNVRNDTVKIPKKQRGKDNTPVVALTSGEGLRFDETTALMAPLQRASLEQRIKTWLLSRGAELNIGHFLSLVDKNLVMRNSSENNAVMVARERYRGVVVSQRADLRKKLEFAEFDDSHFFLGRPVVGLVMSGASQNSHNVVLVHELCHVAQNLVNPVESRFQSRFIAQRYRDELEAYHIGAGYGKALYYSNDERYRKDETLTIDSDVEDIRQQYERSDDPFYPSQALKEALYEAGLYIV